MPANDSKRKKPAIVSLANSNGHRKEAISFITKVMFAKYDNSPDPKTTPETLFLVRRERELIGAIALETPDPELPLPFEEVYSFDRDKLRVPYRKEETVYYCRLSTNIPEVSIPLMYAATVHALEKGFVFGACLIKPSVARLFNLMGLGWQPIKDAKIIIDAVSEADHRYFMQEPAPHPYLIELEGKKRALDAEIQRQIARGDLLINI